MKKLDQDVCVGAIKRLNAYYIRSDKKCCFGILFFVIFDVQPGNNGIGLTSKLNKKPKKKKTFSSISELVREFFN